MRLKRKVSPDSAVCPRQTLSIPAPTVLLVEVSVLRPGQTIATCQRNISQHCWAQHVGCVWPPCCDVLGVVGSNLTIFNNTTAPNLSQHIATRWSNAHNMLRPTMLRYIALACCDRLGGALVRSDIRRILTLVIPSNSGQRFSSFSKRSFVGLDW